MRTIKFRAWDKDNETMIVNYLTIHDLGAGIQVQNGEGRVLHCELMQFTGLLDKNGKEAYHGDLVRQDGFLWQIEWATNGKWFMFSREKDTQPDRGLENLYQSEIIGNIYENPDLLN